MRRTAQGRGLTRKLYPSATGTVSGAKHYAGHCAGRCRYTGEGTQPIMTEQELRKNLELLKTEHRDLDAAIAALTEAARASASADMLQIAR